MVNMVNIIPAKDTVYVFIIKGDYCLYSGSLDAVRQRQYLFCIQHNKLHLVMTVNNFNCTSLF